MRYWTAKPTVPGNPKVSLVVASYLKEEARRVHALRCLVESIKAQTYANWELIVVHDGREGDVLGGPIRSDDPRWKMVYAEHKGKFGHPHRHWAASSIATGDFVGFANDDCYYAPVYFEWLLRELVARKADFAYCDMVHSHKFWKPFATVPKKSRIDVGCFLVRRSLVKVTPWTDLAFNGDGTYVQELMRKTTAVVKVPATLFVHN